MLDVGQLAGRRAPSQSSQSAGVILSERRREFAVVEPWIQISFGPQKRSAALNVLTGTYEAE